jgi:hypothetical protein
MILCTTAKKPLFKKLGTVNSAYSCVEWISHNRVACCGYDNGDIEIREVDKQCTEGKVMQIFTDAHDVSTIMDKFQLVFNSRVIKINIYNKYLISNVCKETVRCVVWDEKMKLLASCSGDGCIKVNTA